MERKLIAAPIRFKAIGTRMADDTKVAQISFVNFDGERISETFNLSEFIPANRRALSSGSPTRVTAGPSRKDQTRRS